MSRFCRMHTPFDAKPADLVELVGASPRDYMRHLRVDRFQLPTICMVRDRYGHVSYLSQREWDRVVPQDHTCMFVTYPQDPVITPTIIGFIAAHATAIISIAAVVAVTVVALSAYGASAKPQAGTKQELPQGRPTYDLADQGNTIRLGQPVTVQYGRMRAYMDVAARPYTEFIGNDQYFFTLLCLGCGSYDIESINIDDTPIGNYAGVTVNVLDPGDTPTLIPTTTETSDDVSDIELGSSFVGPFTATAVGFSANRIDFDVVCPNGLHKDAVPAVQSVIVYGEVRKIDDDGNPIGGWIPAINAVISELAFEPVRRTFSWFVPIGSEGRYEARMRRDGDTGTGNNVDRTHWATLRAYSSVGHFDYGDKTLVEIKIKASDQLNSSNLGIFNAVATRKINVWDGAMFNLEVSRSVVWAFYDMVTNTDYGAGLDPSRVDIDDLYALSQQFDAAGYHCDVRFENSMSAMECLAQIGQAARCQVYQRAGQVWLVRDEPKAVLKALFTPENIVKNSLSITWAPRSELAPDHHRVIYFDNATWREEQVICNLRSDVPERPEDLRLYTVTDRERAWEEGVFFAAQDRYRRKSIEFETDMEGILPTLLDHIGVAHASFTEQTGGRVQAIVGNIIYLNEPVNFGTAEYAYIVFKNADGSVLGPYVCAPGPSQYAIQLPIYDAIDTPIVTEQDEAQREPTTFGFGVAVAVSEVVVTGIEPSGDGKVRIRGVVDDARVHTATDDRTAPSRDDPFAYSA